MLSSSSFLLGGAILLGMFAPILAATGAPNVNSYIYHVYDGVDSNKYLADLQRNLTAANTKGKTNVNLIYSNVTIGETFTGGHLFLTPAQYAIEKKDSRINDMTPEAIGGLAGQDWAPCTSSKPECNAQVPWGLASLTLPPGQSISMTNTTGRSYNPPSRFTGDRVTVYLIDSGVTPNAAEYGERLTIGPNFFPNTPNTDEAGHGTAIASIIGSKTFGVLKKVNILSVKAFNAYKITYSPILLDAFKWVWADMLAKKATDLGSVINLSGYLGERDATIDAALAAFYTNPADPGLYLKNVVMRAAGNVIGADACQFSPLQTDSTYIIQGHDQNNQIVAYNANIGECPTIAAPGIQILGWGPDYTKYIGYGSSMATAFVTGFMAGVLGYNDLPRDRTFIEFNRGPLMALFVFTKSGYPGNPLPGRLSIPPTDAYLTDYLDQPAIPETVLYGVCPDPAAPLNSCDFCNITWLCNMWPA